MRVHNPAQIAHALGPRAYTVNGITIEGQQTQWEFQGDIFVAWNTEQEFAVPSYRFDSTTGIDYLYSTNTTVLGATLAIIIGYIYETQVCGSVPLLGAWNQTAGDYYYTTAVNEHSELIVTSGWVDAGISGYVLGGKN